MTRLQTPSKVLQITVNGSHPGNAGLETGVNPFESERYVRRQQPRFGTDRSSLDCCGPRKEKERSEQDPTQEDPGKENKSGVN
jgi:hypothetical protein